MLVIGAAAGIIAFAGLPPDEISDLVLPTTAIAPPSTTAAARTCEKAVSGPILGSDPGSLSLAISQAAFECSANAVISAGSGGILIQAAKVAAALRAPLLVAGADPDLISGEVDRLGAGRV
ncbi:MAG: hypothetical protein ACT4OP_09230, partial [Actinomycetota bacterium]